MSRNISSFDPLAGVDIGGDNKSLTYLYGLSDFWAYMFEDVIVVNTLLEANATTASDIYTKFLQLSSGIAVADILLGGSAQLKLVTITSADLVQSTLSTYNLSGKYASARHIANRPFLPTLTLEEDSDYRISSNNGTLILAKPIQYYNFPVRELPDGTLEYSLWLVDTVFDEELIYSQYPTLLGLVAPANTSDNYRNFLYGLFSVYTQGPTISLLRKGLNLSIGIPLARDNETILSVQPFPNSANYMVITDRNSYVVPYGLIPTKSVDETLSIGEELATWVEIEDYTTDGEWWLNLSIPTSLIPHIPAGQTSFASAGSFADTMMANYLKQNSFLVRVITTSFKNIQSFLDISSLIEEVKPAYTIPVYVWTVPIDVEEIHLADSLVGPNTMFMEDEHIMGGIDRLKRNSNNPLLRGHINFTRYSLSESYNDLYGLSSELNGITGTYNRGVISGYIHPTARITTPYLALQSPGNHINNAAINSGVYLQGSPVDTTDGGFNSAAMRMTATRGQNYFLYPRSHMNMFRNHNFLGDVSGKPAYPLKDRFGGKRVVLLYVAKESEINEKLVTVGKPILSTTDYIQDVAMSKDSLLANFTTLFTRDHPTSSLGFFGTKDSYRSFLPEQSAIFEGDGLSFVRIVKDVDSLIGVWWTTTNYLYKTQYFWDNKTNDPLQITIEGERTRGSAFMGGPSYFTRGSAVSLTYNSISAGFDGVPNTYALNTSVLYPNNMSNVDITYADNLNATRPFTRNGGSYLSRRILK
jgi:hypothetical protein